jgi:hypothetical protein
VREGKLRVIVSGLIGQYPLGGVTWDYLQYVVGLSRLGHDVYYLEDTGMCPYDPVQGGVARDSAFTVEYLARVMSRYGLGERWAYHFQYEPRWFGMSESRRSEVLASADLLINVSSSLQRPDELRRIPVLAFVDTDPVFTQVKLARGQMDFRRLIDVHDVLFTYGECLSDDVPDTGHDWLPLRKPIVLSEWHPETPHRSTYTTVMNWTSFKPIVYEGRSYGQKDVEFMRFLDLPGRVAPTTLEMAMGEGRTRKVPRELLLRRGWRLVDPRKACSDLDAYRTYIETSKGEWTVAKQGYVIGQAGWFSGRSACYLAAGRPVVVQDTGFAPVIPVGEGVLTFRTLDEAVEAIREVEAHYDRHAAAARGLAEEHFDSAKLLTRLLEGAMSHA